MGYSHGRNELIIRVVPGSCPSADQCDWVVANVPVVVTHSVLTPCAGYTGKDGNMVCSLGDDVLVTLPTDTRVDISVAGRKVGPVALEPLIRQALARSEQYGQLAPPPPPLYAPPPRAPWSEYAPPPEYEPPPEYDESPSEYAPPPEYEPPSDAMPEAPPPAPSAGSSIDAALALLRQYPVPCQFMMALLQELTLNVSEERIVRWLVQDLEACPLGPRPPSCGWFDNAPTCPANSSRTTSASARSKAAHVYSA